MGIKEKVSSLRHLVESLEWGAADSRLLTTGIGDWRLEIKYPLTDHEETAVRSRLLSNPAGFRSPYPPRTVNNIYFDSVDQRAVRANLDGIGERSKVRLRWYGSPSSITDPVLEIKIKSHGAGSKLRMSVDRGPSLTQLSWREIHRILVDGSDPKIHQYLESARLPMIFNSYSREYYESFDHKVRATIDTNIRTADQRHTARPRLDFVMPAARTTVVELKASVTEERTLRQVAMNLGWHVGRHSKYMNGVLRPFG